MASMSTLGHTHWRASPPACGGALRFPERPTQSSISSPRLTGNDGWSALGNTKAAGINAMLRWIEATKGKPMVARIFDELPLEQRKLLSVKVFDNEWVDDRVAVALIQAIDRVLGAGDGAYFRLVGRVVARETLRGIYRIFLKLAGMDVVVRRANSIWRAYFDTGRFEIVEVGKGFARVRLLDYPPYSTTCPGIMGWIDVIYEFYGLDGTIVHPSCRRTGAEFCEFHQTWKAATGPRETRDPDRP